MKVAITGGHLTPALAVIDLLKKENVVFIGRRYGIEKDSTETLEYRTISSLGINFVDLKTGKLQRRLSLQTFISLSKVPSGIVQSLSILSKYKPDVVLGFGGYLSVPVAIAAKILGIPVVIHEQTPGIGLANRIVKRFATKICISWDSSRKFFPKSKTILTGNPIRPEIIRQETTKNQNDKRPLIYVTGGNLGSHAINLLVEKTIYELLEKFEIVHQTGAASEYKDFERFKNLKDNLDEKLKKRYTLKRFLNGNEVGKVLALADLVVTRAGINTICELIYLQKPYLLVPLSLGKEQKENAKYFGKFGFGEFVSQEVSPSYFLSKIIYMFENINKYKENYKNKRNIVKKDSAERIVKVIKNVAKKTPKK